MPTKTRTHEVTVVAPAIDAGANGSAEQKPKLLSRDDILGANDLTTRTVHVPEWGGDVLVRGLTGRARDSLEGRFSDARGNVDRKAYPDFRAAYAALSVVDENGKRLFSESDVQALGEKSSTALQRVFEAAVALSAIRPEDIDGLTTDLKADPSASTGSD